MDLKNELDLDFYISMNEDIALKFEYNYEKIKEHYEHNGIKENRYFSKFHSSLYYQHNWIQYLYKNNDLVKNKINNEKLAFKHYIENGIKEKREIFPVINREKQDISDELRNHEIELLKKTPSLNFIQEYYPSMKNKQKAEIVKYINKNINKKDFAFSLYHEDLYKNYDWEHYLTHNLDLRNANILSKNEAFIHYISCGESEGRVLKKIKINDENENENNQNNTEYNENNENNENINNIKQVIETKKIDIVDEKPIIEEPIIINNDDSHMVQLNPILSEKLNKDDLFDLVKNNINLNNDFIEENIKIQPSINYTHFLYLFDEKYYYLMNSDKFNFENTKDSCLNHFLNTGLNKYLPFNKEHYLTYINSCWNSYKKINYLDKNLTDVEAFHHFIKNKIYFNKSIHYPPNKFNQEYFINSFYNLLYDVIEDNSDKNYYYFLLNEDKDKLFPNNFYYYIYQFIDWNL